jgi:hypothetical protein
MEAELKIENIGGYPAIVHYDEDESHYSICYLGKGGAIIGDSSLVKAIKKFKEAMKIAYEIRLSSLN